MLQVTGLSHAYEQFSGEKVQVLRDVSFSTEKGAYTSIIGPSGCGKTTLLLCLSGLLDVAKGVVSLGGHSPEELRTQHKIGFVFQNPVFFEWMSILDNTGLPARISGLDDSVNQTNRFLQRFGLDGFESSYPRELSGGMLSRAALARALVHEPQYLFLDEAFNYLDEALREEINIQIQEILLDKNITVVCITHSISEAVLMSDRVLVMSQKPSCIIKSCDIPFERPRTPSVRRDTRFVEIVEEIRQALKTAYGNVKYDRK